MWNGGSRAEEKRTLKGKLELNERITLESEFRGDWREDLIVSDLVGSGQAGGYAYCTWG